MGHALERIEDLSFLRESLPVLEEPGMDTLDPDFRTIRDLAHAGDYAGAAKLIAPLLASDVYDLRLVTIYFLARFLDEGLAMLEPIFAGIEAIVGQNREAFGPKQKRDKHLATRLDWTFGTLLEQGQYHCEKGTSTWGRWRASVDRNRFAAAIERGRAVSQALGGSEDPSVGQRLGALMTWLEAIARTLDDGGGNRASKDLSHDAPVEGSSAQPQRTAPAHEIDLDREIGAVRLAVSHAFLDLIRKLRAFARLVEHGRFERAALVVADVQRELDSFDPRVYFPHFFAEYGSLLHRHIAQIAPYWADDEDNPHRRSLVQLYRVDLEAFIEGD